WSDVLHDHHPLPFVNLQIERSSPTPDLKSILTVQSVRPLARKPRPPIPSVHLRNGQHAPPQTLSNPLGCLRPPDLLTNANDRPFPFSRSHIKHDPQAPPSAIFKR
ncbi:hypothetical protein FRC01_007152, partial [Tulasnella sp. 417]